jgi:N-acetylmuramoyl-L-alanine amidase
MESMLKKIVLAALLSIVTLFASDNGALIGEFEKTLNSSDKVVLQKSHQGLKNIYIKSLLSEDKKLQKRALIGIISSAKKLGIAFGDYEKELSMLSSVSIDTPIEAKKPSVLPKKEPAAPKITQKAKPKATSVAKVRYIGSKNEQIKIRFDRPLSKEEIKNFSVKRKNIYADVYDFIAVLPFANVNKRIDNKTAYKLAQNDKNRVRLVVESQVKISSSYEINEEFFILRVSRLGVEKKRTVNKSSIKKSIVRKNKKIVIDPGHGGKDAGAVGYKNYYEKNGVLAIAKKLYGELKDRGYDVYLTRDKDRFLSLKKRTAIANDKKADLFISIHMNAAPKKSMYNRLKGVESYFLSPARSSRAKNVAAKENAAETEDMSYFSKVTFLNFLNREKIVISNKLAIDVQKNILSQLRTKYSNISDGGVREAPFWVLVGAQMPSLLLEVGYITNPSEAKRMFTSKYQKELASGIADGVEAFFAKNM